MNISAADIQAPTKPRLVLLGGAAAIAGLWLLSRPYEGVAGDARIYVGRALGDLDPAGIGRQLDYLHDGQSLFSVFRPVMAASARLLGPGEAAMAIAAAGLALWLAAAALLACRIFGGRTAWAAVACVAVLPLGYGGFSVFHAAEPIATPRIFAEAAGLAALALLIGGQRLFAAGAWLAAMAIHPIMALPVGAVGLVYLAIEDRRWLWLALAGLTGVLAAGALAIPPADRLFHVLDPAWRGLLADRSGEVFPRAWPSEAWGLLACQLTTLWLARGFTPAPFQRLGLATIAVTVAGILLAAFSSSELIVQCQPWRAQWLAATLAGLAFAPCAIGLSRGGALVRAALAWLVFAWICRGIVGGAVFGCCAALILRFVPAPPRLVRGLTLASWLFTATFALAIVGMGVVVKEQRNAMMPAGLALPFWEVLLARLLMIAVVPAALAFALAKLPLPGRSTQAFALAAAISLAAVGVIAWDQRPGATRAREAPDAGRALRAVVGAGDVYWQDGPGNAWLWTRRPEWWNQIQSGGGLFNRFLAMEWDRRFRSLEHAGFASIDEVSITGSPPRPKPAILGLPALRMLCQAPGGPTWVILPLSRTDAAVLPQARMVWAEPVVEYVPFPGDTRWLPVARRAVFRCSDFARAHVGA